MRRLGDKAHAKAEMRYAGVPLLPGTEGTASLEDTPRGPRDRLARAAEGDGGWRRQGNAARQRAGRARECLRCGGRRSRGCVRRRLHLRRACRRPTRHVEIQVLCDADGGVLTLGERECSIQRRHQKLIEESPSCALTTETRESMEAAAERACRRVGYVNAGTFEFILGLGGRALLHRGQLPPPGRASGHRARHWDRHRPRTDPDRRGRASAQRPGARRAQATQSRSASTPRIPRRSFAPAPGTVTRFRPPLGAGVRVDTAITEGAAIPPYYDSMIAKVIVHDATRPAAIARAVRALDELEVAGIPTTRELAIDVLRSDAFASGEYSTSYLADMEDRLPSISPA